MEKSTLASGNTFSLTARTTIRNQQYFCWWMDSKPGHGLGKIIIPAGIVDYGNGPELFTVVADRITGHKPVNMSEVDTRLLMAA